MNLIDLMERPSYPFAPGSHTSFKAAQSLNPKRRGVLTGVYLELLYRCGPLSDEQAYDAIRQSFKIARSSICSIRAGVRDSGLVHQVGEVKAATSGKDVASWGLTAAGRAAQEAKR